MRGESISRAGVIAIIAALFGPTVPSGGTFADVFRQPRPTAQPSKYSRPGGTPARIPKGVGFMKRGFRVHSFKTIATAPRHASSTPIAA